MQRQDDHWFLPTAKDQNA